jgi:serine/threonine protein kinase
MNGAIMSTSLLGKEILGYKVIETLGAGAFGKVYKALKSNQSGNYIRALKHISIPANNEQYESVRRSFGGDVSKTDAYFERMLQSFVSEIQIMNNLSEKGIFGVVRYYEHDIVETNNPKHYDLYILMEYLTPLSDYIVSHDLTVKDAVKLATDILSALEMCHDNDIIHRDIKDANIFVSADGSFKLGDFGISKVLSGNSRAESVKGTPNFLAPEVYGGKESYTKSVDFYSLGIVLYKLLNFSRYPFMPSYPEDLTLEDENTAFDKRMNGETPTLPSLGGEAIGDVVIKAISTKNKRFEDADTFKEELEKAVLLTPDDVLNTTISFASKKPFTEETAFDDGKTVLIFDYLEGDEKNNSLSKSIFGKFFKKTKGETVQRTLQGKDAYNIISDIYADVKLLKQRNGGRYAEALFYNVKKLEEKLAVDSDFGIGEARIIDCETEISKRLDILRESLHNAEKGNLRVNINNMNTIVTEISDLLKRRNELKTR